MTDFDCLLVNGDSYSAPISRFPVYAELVSKKLNVPLYNLAVPGCSNDRILRSTIEQIETLKKQDIKPFIIIGWSFVDRTEIWYHGSNSKVLSKAPDQYIDDVQNRLVTLDWIPNNEITAELKEFLVNVATIDKKIIDWYTHLYLLSAYLESTNISFWFFSAADNCAFDIKIWPAFKNLHMVQKVLSNPKIYNLHQFCIREWAEINDPERNTKTSHLSENGHLKFSEFILEKLYDIQSH